MSKNFRFKLTVILIIFSLLLSLLIAVLDYKKMQKQIWIGQENKLLMAEEKIIGNLKTIDKVYEIFDYQIAEKMEQYSRELLAKYEENPNFASWDFEHLKTAYGMDIYILNAENKVTYSSFQPDIGRDFKLCCESFSKLLDTRREGSSFTHDGMDLQAVTGEIKKFSYMPTPDHMYLIELGMNLENEEIFKQFNFLDTINELTNEIEVIDQIQVYNSDGYVVGVKSDDGDKLRIDGQFYAIFKEVKESGQYREMIVNQPDGQLTYRFIPYQADEKRGFSTERVVAIVYNDHELRGVLSSYKNQFITQLLVILAAAVALSFIIARLVAKPIHLAFHDSLTGLKNRAAFEDELQKRLEREKSKVALMMIDLDNFKAVNDQLGHGEGDRLLQVVAKTIEEVIGSSNFAARVGGDEFLVILDSIHSKKIGEISEELLKRINEEISFYNTIHTSISIGAALSCKEDDFDSLYKKADEALYKSNENGKNQYTLYSCS